jgi:uracil-DNA glycosylase
MKERRLLRRSIQDVEALVDESLSDANLLQEIEHELTCRSTGRAKRLLKRVRERLDEVGRPIAPDEAAPEAASTPGHFASQETPPSETRELSCFGSLDRDVPGVTADGGAIIAELLAICERNKGSAGGGAVVDEPYIPFLPRKGRRPGWNGVLVLGEAQNLSAVFAGFVRRLQASTPRERHLRLYWDSERHVRPWDDGTLQLAVEAVFNRSAEEFGVGNAVLWSTLAGPSKNEAPRPTYIRLSMKVWREMLPLLSPQCVVTTGATAKKVIGSLRRDARGTWCHLPLSSASPRYLNTVSGKVDEATLLRMTPEVERVVARHPEWVTKFRQNKIFFACEAVQIAKTLCGRLPVLQL